jgi:hypothetical protein
MKTSYSQSGTYKDCPQHWKFKYKDKIDVPNTGASTFFGSAVDSAVMALLEGKPDYMGVFYSMWQEQKNYSGERVALFDNPDIVYAYADFDNDLFELEHMREMEAWVGDLGLNYLGNSYLDIYKQIAKIKNNIYKHLKHNELIFFNRVSWLSMRIKGKILIQSFVDDFYPQIEEVLATQKRTNIKDPVEGDVINGVIDMVLKLKNHDLPIVFDLKTAARPYKPEQIEYSEQLALYSAMAGNVYGTNKVGYVVLCKQIHKDKVSYCEKCQHKKDGKHKTCNNTYVVEDKVTRCGGNWQETTIISPKVQVLIADKSGEEVNAVLMDQENIIKGMKHEVIYRNLSKCDNWYGNVCPYKKICLKKG